MCRGFNALQLIGFAVLVGGYVVFTFKDTRLLQHENHPDLCAKGRCRPVVSLGHVRDKDANAAGSAPQTIRQPPPPPPPTVGVGTGTDSQPETGYYTGNGMGMGMGMGMGIGAEVEAVTGLGLEGTDHDVDSEVVHEHAWPVRADGELWDEVVKSRNCSLDWSPVVAQQLAQWKETGYTQKQVDEFCVKKVVRASYVRGELRLQTFGKDNKNPHRLRCGFWLIKTAAMRAEARGDPIAPFEIPIQPGDTAFSTTVPRKQWDNAGPIFGNVKCNDASVSFPLTLHDMFGEGNGEMGLGMYARLYARSLDWSGDASWKELNKKAFFSAGAGAQFRGNRTQLQNISEAHPELLNTSRGGVKMNVMAEYQYNVYAYGHCGWSRRIRELAMLRTVVLVEESVCREYVHGLFQPGIDHIPVKEDFSDVVEQLQRVTDGPQSETKMEAMANAWGSRGQEMLSLGCTLDYVELLLRELAKLQQFQPQYHPEWDEYTFERGHLWFLSRKTMDASECKRPTTYRKNGIPRSHKC
jgi:hypothetical protein